MAEGETGALSRAGDSGGGPSCRSVLLAFYFLRYRYAPAVVVPASPVHYIRYLLEVLVAPLRRLASRCPSSSSSSAGAPGSRCGR